MSVQLFLCWVFSPTVDVRWMSLQTDFSSTTTSSSSPTYNGESSLGHM